MPIDSFTQQISSLEDKASKAFNDVETLDNLKDFHQTFLGKKSFLKDLLKSLKGFSSDEKREFGPNIQMFRKKWELKHSETQKKLELDILNQKLASDWVDVTKEKKIEKGAIHPISIIQRQVENIFVGMGFEIADGPEVETEWHNFDALNIPATHPARDMQDTFFVNSQNDDSHENSVLRTHGTCIDIRKIIEKGVPIRTIAPARVYRNEDIDATHDAMFYQIDGLLIDKGISMAHLKGVMEEVLSAVFEKEMKVRIRPGYFPFVEPGLEIDIWWEYKTKSGELKAKWLEFCGAGMLHPNVLRNCGVDPEEYGGFAFGFGLTRLVMMKYGIDDIRLLTSKKKEFLEQF